MSQLEQNGYGQNVVVKLPLRLATIEDLFYYDRLGNACWSYMLPIFIRNANDELECETFKYPASKKRVAFLQRLIEMDRVYVFRKTEVDDPVGMIEFKF